MATFPGRGGGFSQADLATNYVVQQDPVTEVLQVAGVDIPPAIPIAWADFILLDWTQLDGIFYRVTDVHSVGSTGGSLWMADAAGDRPVLKDGPLQYADLDDAPSPVTYPGLRVRITGLPGRPILESDGTNYRSEAPYVVLQNNITPLSRAKGSSPDITTEWLPVPTLIPRDVLGNSLMRPGDYLAISNGYVSKTGVTDQLTVKLRAGSSNSASDTQLITVTDATTTIDNRWFRDVQLARKADAAGVSVIGFRGLASTTFTSGGYATDRTADVSLATAMDSVATYFNLGALVSGTPTDTALNVYEWEVRLHRGS